jgi:acyl phosphate:glycerol-3-phosphate acyltransferase
LETFLIALTVITGYLLGSLNSSLIVGKLYGVDIRKKGSGNAGLTNTMRVLGKTAALAVLAGDIIKGIIACIVGLLLVGQTGILAGGTAAVIGHNWPLYFGFKGGKGVLTTLAVIMMMDWRIGLLLLGVFLIIVFVTRYVSLGSIIGAALIPVFSFLFGKDAMFILFSFFLGLLIIIRHYSNLSRLINGTESKLGKKV